MKKNIHPKMYPAIFVDSQTSKRVFSMSTKQVNKKETVEGVEHNVFIVEVSSFSHPFYTGEQRFLDTAGRVDKFEQRRKAGEKNADVIAARIAKKQAEKVGKTTKSLSDLLAGMA
jgi:large subunit ribosomal protein L31